MKTIHVTKNCVLCGKPMVTAGGYVLHGAEKIIAGWCRHHSKRTPDIEGYVGHWRSQDGIKKWEEI